MSVRYWEDWFDIEGGPLVRAYHLLQKIDLGPQRGSERGPLLEFNIGSHPGNSTHYVNAKDMLSLSLLQARLVDLGMPIKIVGGYLEVQMRLWLKVKNRHIRRAG